MKLKRKTLLFFIGVTGTILVFYFSYMIPFAKGVYYEHLKDDFHHHFMHFNVYLREFYSDIRFNLDNLVEDERFLISEGENGKIINYLSPRTEETMLEMSEVEVRLRKNLIGYKNTKSTIQNVYIGFENGSIVSNRGRLNNHELIYDPRKRPWYKLAKENQNEAVITEFYPSPVEKNIYFVAGAKTINDIAGNQIGVFGFDVNLDNLLSYFLTISKLSNGELLILQSDSLLLLSKNGDIETLPKEELIEVREKTEGLNSKGELVKFGDEKYFIMVEKFDIINWTLIFRIPVSNIDKIIVETLLPFVLKGLLMILFTIVLIAFGINKILFSPIKGILATTKDIVLKGEISGEDKYVIDDELGFLSNSFREMALELKEHKDNLEKLIAERTLELSKYSMVVEQSSTIIVMTDPEGNLEYVNPKFLSVTGYTMEEVIGKNPKLLKSGVTSQEVYIEMWNAITNGKAWRGELCNRKKNGELYWEDTSIFPVKNDSGEIINYVAVKEDITEKKEILKSLKESEEKFRIIADFTFDWECWISNDKELLWTNPAVERISGYSIEEVMEMQDFSSVIFSENYIDKFNSIFDRAIKGKQIGNDVILQIEKKDGEIIWGAMSWNIVYDSSGNVVGVRTSVRDITKRRKDEMKILENDKKLKNIIDSSPAMMAIRDKEGKFKTLNREYRNYIDKPYGEVINKTLYELYKKELAEKSKLEDNLVFDTGEKLIKDLELRKNGEKRIFYETRFPIENLKGEIIEVGEWVLDITERVRSENEMKLLLKSVSEGIIGVDTDVKIKFINDSALKLLKITREEALNSKVCELIFKLQLKSNEFDPAKCPIFNSILQRQKIFVSDGEFSRSDETSIDVEYTSVPIINENEIEGAVVVFRDISEKLKTEKVIRESEERFKFSLESIGAFYWVINSVDKTIEYDSPVFFEQYGYGSVENPFNISDWLEYTTEEDGKKLMLNLTQYLQGESEKFEVEFKLRKTNGDYVWLMNIGRAIEWNENGEVVKVAGITLDIDERKIAEQFLENMFEATPVPVFITSLQTGNVYKGNRAVLDFLDCTREELYTINVKSLYVNLDRDRPKLIKAFQQNKRIEIEIMKYKTNEKRWCLFSGKEIEYNNERCLLGSFIDVTELREAREEAEKATIAKSNFLANMSHEIRTPMNAIIGLNDLLYNSSLSTKQKDYVEKISGSANNLLGIINDILDFSKIEAGKLELENIHFSLDNLLDDLTNVVAMKAHEKNLELVIIKDSRVPNELVGDPLRLQQILLNLVNNAIKFTENGEVILRIIQHTRKNNLTKLCFNIKDTGIGMTKGQTNKLFASFSQADESTTRKYGGTGLGLSISKSLVEMMGGNISVKSEFGQGTTFTFDIDFPIVESAESSYRDLFNSLKNIKILAVDDNKNVRRAMKGLLSDVTKHLKLVSSSQEVIEEAKQEKYDLLIMDYSLPELNGLNTWNKIKSELSEENLPKLILMASYGEENFEYLTLSAGIDNILYKPLSKRQLLDMILENFSIETFINVKSNLVSEYPIGFDEIRGAKILLVEDNKINQQVAKELLLREEFWIDIAENGQEAIARILEKEYDLVLLDLQMPILDGYAAAKIIREEHKIDELPLIALSADAMSGTREKVLDAGMNDYITKPIDKNILFKVLTDWIKPLDRDKNIFESENESSIVDVPKLKKELASIDVYDALKRVSGNINLYVSILKKFHNDYKGFLANLAELINNGEREKILRAVHTLKGTSGNIGAIILNSASMKLESIMKELNIITLESIDEEIKILKLELDNTLGDIKKLLDYIDKLENGAVHETIEISKEELLEKMEELREYIENYNTGAFMLHENLKKFLAKEELRDKYEKLGELIDEYEFEDALKIYEELINLL